jgi:hypothetical protein
VDVQGDFFFGGESTHDDCFFEEELGLNKCSTSSAVFGWDETEFKPSDPFEDESVLTGCSSFGDTTTHSELLIRTNTEFPIPDPFESPML